MKKNFAKRTVGTAIIGISIVSILVHLASVKENSGYNLMFWVYMIVSAINILAGTMLLYNKKDAAKIAIYIIALTFVSIEGTWALINKSFIFGYTLMSAVIPAILIYFLVQIQNKKIR